MKNRVAVGYALAVVLAELGVGSSALACDFCMLGQGVSPYMTTTGQGVSLNLDYAEANRVYDGGKQVADANKKEAWSTYSLTGFYAVTADLTVLATLPYVMKTNLDYDKDSNTTPGVLVDGVGDASVTGRYTLLSDHSEARTVKLGVLAVKLPTGKTDVHDVAGGPVDRHALPGTGSVDYLLGLNSALAFGGAYQVTCDVVFDKAGKGSWDGGSHRYGDGWNFALEGYLKLSGSASGDTNYFVYTGLSGETIAKETGVRSKDGYDPAVVNASSGGTVGFWDLGLYGNLGVATIVDLGYSRAVFHRMNLHPAFDGDPAEAFKLKVGLTRLIMDVKTAPVAAL